jgi:putative transposase
MARTTRLKFADPHEGCYHVTSRTVLKSFLFKDQEKDYFLRLLRRLSRVYFVRVVSFTVMSNHFHLIVKMIPSTEIPEEELHRRFDYYYNEGVPKKRHRSFDPLSAGQARKRWEDISCFMQDLKQRFSRWYNRQIDGTGHVWSDRFCSVLLESGRALIACMVYVELNSVRAGMIERPEDYRFCSLFHYFQGGRAANWLDFRPFEEILTQWGESFTSPRDFLRKYLELVYLHGIREKDGKSSISKEIVSRNATEIFNMSEVLPLSRRVRSFSCGVVLGSKGYLEEKVKEHRSFFRVKRLNSGRPLLDDISIDSESLLNFFVLKKLRTRFRS